MITIFNIINDALFHKKGNVINNISDESTFNGYMINRWISMYSPNMATVINYTSNKFYSIFDTKYDQYKFLCSVLPKVKPRRIFYIKKVNKKHNDIDKAVTILANNLELSKREINHYIQRGAISSSQVKQLCQ